MGIRWGLPLAGLAAAALLMAADDPKARPADAVPLAGTATITSTTGPRPPPSRPLNLFSLLAPADREAELERRHLAGGAPHEVVERVTRGLLAAPYLLSPLGEGPGAARDPDPRFRLDAFDCTTFVETAIAMARCDELDEVARLMDRIRYLGGRVGFETRRHLMTSQWLPGLVRAGLLEDVTREVGGEATMRLRLVLTEARWQNRRVARALPLDAEHVPTGSFELHYIPVKEARARAARVPPGTVINVVRADWAASPDVVTHQGLVIVRPGGQRRWVRHASPVARRVIDETLDHMLKRYERPRKWPVVGVSFYRIVSGSASAPPRPSRTGEPRR